MTIHTQLPPDLAAARTQERGRVIDLREWRRPKPTVIGRVLASMRASDPKRDWCAELREALAARIERDIEILDALDGDPDFEPSLGAPEPVFHGDFRHVPAPDMPALFHGSQETWAEGIADDREEALELDGDTALSVQGGRSE